MECELIDRVENDHMALASTPYERFMIACIAELLRRT